MCDFQVQLIEFRRKIWKKLAKDTRQTQRVNSRVKQSEKK